MTCCFEENLLLFQYKNPRAAALLSCIDESRSVKSIDQEKEVAAWVTELDLSSVEILTVFGIGSGYAYEALKKWLHTHPKVKIIFVEDDLSVLLHFLESPRASEILTDRQVQLYYIEDSHEGLEVLKAIAWASFGKKMCVTAIPSYMRLRYEVFCEIDARLQYEISDIHAVCDEYTNYGIAYFRNFWRNLFLLDGAYRGNALKGAFRQIPAIVVAAGPSLKKQLSSLGALQDRALIFSGGSSVNALTEAGIMPHFAAGVDPNPLQYMRLRQNLAVQTPFFYSHRLLHEAAMAISGPRLYLRGGDGYGVSNYFEKKAKISGTVLGGGHSVANLSIELAFALGCSPIILIGFDLAFGTGAERYAPGIEESHPSSAQVTKDTEIVVWKDHQDKPIKTAWKWVQEGEWIETFCKKHGKNRFINATEGGLGIKGIKHMPLQVVHEQYLTRQYDLEALLHTQLEQAGTIECKTTTIFKGMAHIFDSLTDCIEFLDQLIANIAHNRKIHPLENPENILLLQKLHETVGYETILEVFDRMKTKFDYYTLQFCSHAKQPPDELLHIERDLLAQRYFFLKEVCIVNHALIQKTVLEQQSKGVDISSFAPTNTSING